MKDIFFIALGYTSSIIRQYPYLCLILLSCLVYLFFQSRTSVTRTLLGGGTLFLLFIYFCPVSAMLIYYCLSQGVYYRTLWLIPLIPLVCYTATDLLLRLKGLKRFCLFMALLLCITVPGSYMFKSSNNFHKVTNPYKLPQEVIDTANWLPDGACIVGADWLVPFIRQYNPTITLVNTRWKRLPIDTELDQPYPDLAVLGPLLQSSNCDFIAIGQDKNLTIKGKWEDYGFHFYRGDNRCIIFINENSSFYSGEP